MSHDSSARLRIVGGLHPPSRFAAGSKGNKLRAPGPRARRRRGHCGRELFHADPAEPPTAASGNAHGRRCPAIAGDTPR